MDEKINENLNNLKRKVNFFDIERKWWKYDSFEIEIKYIRKSDRKKEEKIIEWKIEENFEKEIEKPRKRKYFLSPVFQLVFYMFLISFQNCLVPAIWICTLFFNKINECDILFKKNKKVQWGQINTMWVFEID